uniref:Uncharacterized protein n=1 Tax=Plectus sambesii TaxID=2011161 RepID=A0A914VX48_9BILA
MGGDEITAQKQNTLDIAAERAAIFVRDARYERRPSASFARWMIKPLRAAAQTATQTDANTIPPVHYKMVRREAAKHNAVRGEPERILARLERLQYLRRPAARPDCQIDTDRDARGRPECLSALRHRLPMLSDPLAHQPLINCHLPSLSLYFSATLTLPPSCASLHCYIFYTRQSTKPRFEIQLPYCQTYRLAAGNTMKKKENSQPHSQVSIILFQSHVSQKLKVAEQNTNQ